MKVIPEQARDDLRSYAQLSGTQLQPMECAAIAEAIDGLCREKADLFNALSVLADAAEARSIPVDAARAALAKAQGGAA